jgi:hypothetical protein
VREMLCVTLYGLQPLRLQHRPRSSPSTCWSSKDKDLRSLPLLKRKAALQKELQRTTRIVYCQHAGEIGERLFQAAEHLGLESVIVKKAYTPTGLAGHPIG